MQIYAVITQLKIAEAIRLYFAYITTKRVSKAGASVLDINLYLIERGGRSGWGTEAKKKHNIEYNPIISVNTFGGILLSCCTFIFPQIFPM